MEQDTKLEDLPGTLMDATAVPMEPRRTTDILDGVELSFCVCWCFHGGEFVLLTSDIEYTGERL